MVLPTTGMMGNGLDLINPEVLIGTGRLLSGTLCLFEVK